MSLTAHAKALSAAAIFGLAGLFNTAAAREPDMDLPRPAPLTTTQSNDNVQTPGQIITTSVQAQLNASLAAAFEDLNVQMDAKRQTLQRGDIYEFSKDRAYDAAVERIITLIESGANPEYYPGEGITMPGVAGMNAFAASIVVAGVLERPDLVQLFLDHGASATLAAPDGWTPMDYAILNIGGVYDYSTLDATMKIVAMLVDNGATFEQGLNGSQSLGAPRALTAEDFARSPLQIRMLSQYGLVDSSKWDEMFNLTDAEAALLQAQTDVTAEFLQTINAPVIPESVQDLIPALESMDYVVQPGDSLWELSQRFAVLLPANDVVSGMHELARANGITLDAENNASRPLQIGETLRVPMSAHVSVAKIEVLPFDGVLGMAHRLQEALGAPSLDQAINMLLEANGINTPQAMEAFAASGAAFKYTPAGGTESMEARPEGADIITGLATRLGVFRSTSFSDRETFDKNLRGFLETMSNLNTIDVEGLFGGSVLPAIGDAFNMSVVRSDFAHLPQLRAPEGLDPDRRVSLIVIEPEDNEPTPSGMMHGQTTFASAANTTFALDNDADLTQIIRWNEGLFDYQHGSASDALRLLMNLEDSPLRDTLIFSFSMAMQVPEPNGDSLRNMRTEDDMDFETIRVLLDEMEANRPIIFAGAGNWRQKTDMETPFGMMPGPSDGNYVQSYLMMHSPRAVNVGAAGEYSYLTSEDSYIISDYSTAGADICAVLPKVNGQQEEGTSFATPVMAAVMRHMVDWYGDRLTFEEIFAAGMMVAGRDVMDYDPFGDIQSEEKNEFGTTEAVESTFRVNGGGVPIHARCGGGLIERANIGKWRDALNTMVELKAAEQEAGQEASAYTTTVIEFGEAAAVETAEDGTPTYVYHVTAPADLTLDKLTFLLPQFMGAHTDVSVRTPAGFEAVLPKSMYDIVSSRVFSYEDVKAGDVIEIRTGAPLGESAAVYLRGHSDGNLIQTLRNQLLEEGVLFAPNTVLEGGVPVTPQENPAPAPVPGA